MNTIHNASSSDAAPRPLPERFDRDIPKLKTKRKTRTAFRIVLLVIGLLMIILLGFAASTMMNRMQARKAEQMAAKAKAKPETAAAPRKANFEGYKKRLLEEQQTKAAQEAAASALVAPASARENFADAKMGGGDAVGASGATSLTNGRSSGGESSATARSRPQTKEQRQLSGELLVGDAGYDAKSSVDMPASATPQLPQLSTVEPRQNTLEQQLKSTRIEAVAAIRRKNMDLLIRAGMQIPCGQYTYIVSTNPGQATCVVSKDVYSANGKTLLIEAGSTVLGERQQPLQLGQKFMPVLWTRLDTPRGVSIDINSLATDSLGASGLPVQVDTHFGERFGAAILLSLISDLGDAAANAASNGGNTIRLGTTAGVGEDLASKTLDKTINIPPTGYSVQGSAINIFVARDLDFGRVYELARY
jgi:type IV secretion system protein VirB10